MSPDMFFLGIKFHGNIRLATANAMSSLPNVLRMSIAILLMNCPANVNNYACYMNFLRKAIAIPVVIILRSQSRSVFDLRMSIAIPEAD
jgi:hypothetical protein